MLILIDFGKHIRGTHSNSYMSFWRARSSVMGEVVGLLPLQAQRRVVWRTQRVLEVTA